MSRLRPPPKPKPTKKPCYLGVPAIFKLDLACMNLYQAFCVGGKFGGIYLVGSALERPDFRDVDVVCMLADEDFAGLFPDVHHVNSPDIGYFEQDPRWLILSVTISEWLSQQIDMTVDFKFQPMTFANARHGKMRHPLGHRTIALRLSEPKEPEGPKPIPPTAERIEMPASEIGVSLELSEETKRELAEIGRNSAMASIRAKDFVFD